MYNISEMVSVMGKRKKMPTTLGINLGTGMLLIAPERAHDAPPQEWSADKMTHYSREGKHVFMELVRPSKSIDFHAGAKDTAEEIVLALGEMAGAVRAEGLKEVIMAGTQRYQRKGKVLYDFMAQSQDEVTVAAGDEVIILDDSKSEEWWQLRRLKNGKEGVVPSSYIEIMGTVTPPPPNETGARSGMSSVEQNRLEEMRLTKEALKASKDVAVARTAVAKMATPPRASRVRIYTEPDTTKVRTWTDRSKSFSVDAQFLGLRDGKIHLHKMNGVKIAVPIAKMSKEDLEYVENLTGISLEDEKPLADVRRSKSMNQPSEPTGAKVERTKKPEYDWFQFFLSCDVPVGLCERYAQAFIRDSMDESVLPDVNAVILRTLGIREGDIIKIMRTLDTKFGRERNPEGDSGTGGLFSGPGGALRNNTRKARPAPAVQTNDVVDAVALSKDSDANATVKAGDSPVQGEAKPSASGFDDDAWDVKPSKQSQPAKSTKPIELAPSSAPAMPELTGSLKDLSMLSAPLEPTKAEPVKQPETTTTIAIPASTLSPTPPLPGANPSFFSSISGSQSGGPASPKSLARQRPAPTMPTGQGSLPPPPTQRPISAPQSHSAFATPALSAQMTSLVQGQVAPPGQSLNDITQVRLQQQYAAQMQQMQALQPTMTGYGSVPNQPPMVSYPPGAQYVQAMYTGVPQQSPFQDPGVPNQFPPLQAQHTTYPQFQPQSSFGQAAQGNVNNYLPPALEPQRTGLAPVQQPQATGFNSFNPQHAHALQPQKTGPPPPVRFGVVEAKKLTAQPTGRRANLSQRPKTRSASNCTRWLISSQ
ncbi:cytoskeleton assembly control protein Sla1 [Cordyceps javanica]|uniref:Actin cytoskeleton-regulatory complex protein SLA1 n=1 Tax=Cordyceps javanica TaxID=43265 RepID=A0A545V2T4_9HYPO|nr:cytoskeleton assembly control protein Sla1 [Cordyceps javanica]